MRFCAILLAAGRSSRMGRVKALLPLPALSTNGGECSALEGIVRLYRSVGLADILVVSGFRAEAVEDAARALSVTAIGNPHPEQGMFSSVRAGLQAAPSDCDAFFIHPVDVPLVAARTLRLLADAASADEPAALIPRHNGEEGHPPLLPAVFADAVLNFRGEGGLRSALAMLPWRAVDTPDPFVLEDMDTQPDYARLRALALERTGEQS